MKTIVLTGATSGIGMEIARELLFRGHQVISGARSIEKARNVEAGLIQSTGSTRIAFFETDFADFESVKRFAEKIKSTYSAIDVLINNAGTWEMEFIENKNRLETNLQVNHLSPMLLTLELLPSLLKSANARIINTSSGAHRRDILILDDLAFRQRPYDGVATYSQSKLLNILFSLELSERLKQTNITVNTVHPGYVKTALFNKMSVRSWDGIPDARQGAQSALYAALSPELEGVTGRYFYLNNEDPNLSAMAKDPMLAKKAWDLSFAYLKAFTGELKV